MSASENVDTAALALLAHKIAPFQFDIGFAVSSASIRDQIVRAQMVVGGLQNAGLLQRAEGRHLERPLLICGAGIAGLAAAKEAARLRIGFVLIDKVCFPGGALKGNGNRFLSPTMYEWPASLCNEHNHPRRGKDCLAGTATTFDLPLGRPVTMTDLRTRISAIIGRNLTDWTRRAAKRQTGNWYLPETCIHDDSKEALQALLDAAPSDPKVSLPPIKLEKIGPTPTTPLELEFACILFAGGFSAESKEIDGVEFDTPPFWEKDTLTEPFLGLKKTTDRASALIVGAGDGAIQEALRCLVRHDLAEQPLAIWNKLIDDSAGAKVTVGPAATILGDHTTIESILREILSLENYAATTYMWSGNAEIFKSLDAAHVRLCGNLLRLCPAIAKHIKTLLRKDVSEVRVQRRGDSFSKCYPLNRFLIHLFHATLPKLARGRNVPRLSFGDTELKNTELKKSGRYGKSELSGKAMIDGTWKEFDVIVLRKGGDTPRFQAIGLTGIDAARTNFGRIVPPFVAP